LRISLPPFFLTRSSKAKGVCKYVRPLSDINRMWMLWLFSHVTERNAATGRTWATIMVLM